MKHIWVAFLLIGCSNEADLIKKLEAKIYDDIAKSVNAHCEERKRIRYGIGTELISEAARDVSQRTVQYNNLDIGEQFHSLTVVCAGNQPEIKNLHPFYFESGWSPGQCASKNSKMGCPPNNWQFTEGNWLHKYEIRHCKTKPGKCTLGE